VRAPPSSRLVNKYVWVLASERHAGTPAVNAGDEIRACRGLTHLEGPALVFVAHGEKRDALGGSESGYTCLG